MPSHHPSLPCSSPVSGINCVAVVVALLVALLVLQAMPAAAQPGATAAVHELLRRGQTEAALQTADRALAVRPGDAEARFLRSVVLMEMRRDDEALAAFARLTEDFPELPDPWNNIALLHARAGRPEAARQALETALRNDPTHRTARINLGQVHLMLAAQSWEQAATAAALEPALRQKLEAVRALLQR